jgi:aminodeoxychorismate lyase
VHAIIYLNKTMVEAAKARIAPLSSAMLFGRGVFTTVAIYRGAPFFWSEHWQRLEKDAQRLGIDCGGLNQRNVGEALKQLINVNGVEDGRARIILLSRGEEDRWKFKAAGARKTDILIMTDDRLRRRETGLTLAVSRFRANTGSPLVGVKSLNYLNQVLAMEEARERDFDEAVMLNERGEIVSATMANIFWVKDGTLHTPNLSSGAIGGVTRGAVIDLAAQHFIPLVEGVYELADLTEADEIFLTSTSLGIAIVTTFDFRQYSVATGSVAARLREAFMSLYQ